MRRLLAALLAALLATGVVGCGESSSGPYPVSKPPSPEEDALRPGDLFEVRVFGEDDLAGAYKVSPDGTINFPLIGSVKVEGLTASAVEREIQSRLADGYLRNPQVSVLIKEQGSKKFSVLGQVRSPGTFPYSAETTIVDAIAKAGGFTALAKKNSVRVTRSADGKMQRIEVAVEDIGQGRAPNFVLRPGDVVFVPERLF